MTIRLWHRPLILLATAMAALALVSAVGLAVDDRILVGAAGRRLCVDGEGACGLRRRPGRPAHADRGHRPVDTQDRVAVETRWGLVVDPTEPDALHRSAPGCQDVPITVALDLVVAQTARHRVRPIRPDAKPVFTCH